VAAKLPELKGFCDAIKKKRAKDAADANRLKNNTRGRG
jgi:hypothetical protein